ncbi:MAG TPA: ABC transporter permease [Saprospiraceae bacterium]|nr:ABC transporter permease [Saprospiraceae bacterium]
MRSLLPFLHFIRKEALHIWRDKQTLVILLGMPLAQILIFGFALTNEVKNSPIAIIDGAKDRYSADLIQKISASKYFDLVYNFSQVSEADDAFKKNQIKVVLIFPSDFTESLEHQHKGNLQIIADGTDPNTATAIVSYLSAIISGFQMEILQRDKLPLTIQPQVKMLYNPQLKGVYNFVPGVMAMILLLVCTLMTSVSIVREKELGTMEILLASPVKPALVITAKMVPYLFLSMFNIASILILSVTVFEMPINGSLLLLFFCSLIFIVTALMLGLMISTITDTQMTAMFISMVGMFLPTVMLSGFMFPIENMPKPLQFVSNIVPAKYYYIMVKNIMIKGLGWSGIQKQVLTLLFMIVVISIITIRNFKPRLA